MLIITPILIISCIIIAVLCYLFLNTIEEKRKWLNAILALIFTPIVYFFIWYPLSTIFLPYHHQKQFDSEAWKTEPGLRYEMIDHMIETDFLIGKDQKEVQQILGNVQWLSWDYTNNNFDANAWNYGLGLIPGAFTKTKEDVEIIFTKDIVQKVSLTQSEYIIQKIEEETQVNKKLDSINALNKQ